MLKLLVLFTVIAAVAGCAVARLKLGAPVSALATNAPSGVTNSVTLPDLCTVKLDATSQGALVDAIKAAGHKSDGPLQVVLTNANPIILHPTVTNTVSFPNSMLVNLDEPTHRALQDATADRWFKKELFFSSLLGAAVAVLAGFILHRIEVCQRRRDDKEFVRNVLRSIEAELDALSEIFDQGIGKQLKAKTGRMFLVRLALSQDYFTVFGANAVHLGKIDPENAKAIISLYQTLKALIEAFRINNEYIQMHDTIVYQLSTTFPVRPDGVVRRGYELEALLNQQGDDLVRMAESVQHQYDALKEALSKLK